MAPGTRHLLQISSEPLPIPACPYFLAFNPCGWIMALGNRGGSLMAERAEITLARALKLKNRLAGRLAKLDSDFENYNSLPAGTDRPDLKGLYAERNTLV